MWISRNSKSYLLECVAYSRERLGLIQSVIYRGVRNYILKELLEGTNYTIHERVFKLPRTGKNKI